MAKFVYSTRNWKKIVTWKDMIRTLDTFLVFIFIKSKNSVMFNWYQIFNLPGNIVYH